MIAPAPWHLWKPDSPHSGIQLQREWLLSQKRHVLQRSPKHGVFGTNHRTCLQHHTVSIILDYLLIIYYINITYYLLITYYYCTSRTVHMTLAKCSAVKFCAWFLKTWRGALLMRPAHSTQPWHTTMPRFFRWSQVRTLRSDSMPAPLARCCKTGLELLEPCTILNGIHLLLNRWETYSIIYPHD